MKYIALICARGGSKGLPNKNIKLLGGVPLIGWAISVAKKIEKISRIIVSTDSDQIAKIARDFGGEVPFIRPNELAQDNSPEWLVWRHAVDFLKSQNHEFGGLVVIPPTAPLRNSQDVINCINEFEKGGADIVITVSDAHRNPYFNMVATDKEGYLNLVIPPQKAISRRQDVPEVFDMTTVAYVVNPQFVKESQGMFGGRVRSVHIPLERALDIDNPLDFKIAQWLITENKGNT